MIELSIIIPVYNVDQYLRDCFGSLLNQDFRNIELIVVDDGSTDSSLNICNEYAVKDKRVVVVHKENGGVSSARNMALKLVRGKYITFVDPDDFIASDSYLENINYLQTHPDVDCVQFPYCHYYSSTNIDYHYLDAMLIEGKHDLFKNWWAGSIISFSLCHKIFRRKIFYDINFKEGHVSEDTLLIPRLCSLISSLYISPRGMYYYRQRINSYTYHYSFTKHIDMFNAHYEIYGMFALFPDLYCEKVIAFTRMLRRLITAKSENIDTDVTVQIKLLSRAFPSWLEICKSHGTEKMFLFVAKILGLSSFLSLETAWLNYVKK